VRTPRGEFLGCAGYADLKRQIPMRTNHAFQIGSITKSFVGVVCAQMHAEGILNLDTCITNTWYMATEAARGEVAHGYEDWFSEGWRNGGLQTCAGFERMPA
jgi:CubicO group peptidase (beta-lactamase class C family)